jgi:c-di-AMP phosphodiesterase-like protein
MKKTDGNRKKNSNFSLYPTTIISVVVCAVLSVVMFFYNIYVAIVALFILLFIVLFGIVRSKTDFRKLENSVIAIDKKLSADKGNAELMNFPLPVLLFDSTDRIIWYNSLFRSEILKDSIYEKL